VVEDVIGRSNPLGDGAEPLPSDFKSALQEMAQAMKLPQPRYYAVREHGPEHSKTFTVEVRLGKEWSAQAGGASKKAAGQEAARELIDKLHESLGRPDAPPGG
jgi:ribonuclease-3